MDKGAYLYVGSEESSDNTAIEVVGLPKPEMQGSSVDAADTVPLGAADREQVSRFAPLWYKHRFLGIMHLFRGNSKLLKQPCKKGYLAPLLTRWRS